jgi:hypothetical protein
VLKGCRASLILLLMLTGCSSSTLPSPDKAPVGTSPAPKSAPFTGQSSAKSLKIELKEYVNLSCPGEVGKLHWWRSAGTQSREMVEDNRFPLVDLGESKGASFQDKRPPIGVHCRYWVSKADSREVLASGSIEIPARSLGPVGRCRIEVDKSRYLLSVVDLDSQTICKDYPVVFGRKRLTRKLQMDNASTPEGIYTISNLQPQATFHRAYDVDYPNKVDKARHELLPHDADIGGEIQIHGRGIHSNWTFGCVALRDEDIDELFACPAIKAGCPLWIYGGELTYADLVSASSGANRPNWSPLELGRWQLEKHLNPSCIWDVASAKVAR